RGPNPQRGEPSCRSQPRISKPSRAFSQPAISCCAIRGAADLHLIPPRSRALMYTRLTPPRRKNHDEETIEQHIAKLSRMTGGQLTQKYIDVFGEETPSNNRQFLFRRIWRIQALAEGGLSERARRRALEIANDADIRVRAPNKKALDPEFLKVTARLPKPRD